MFGTSPFGTIYFGQAFGLEGDIVVIPPRISVIDLDAVHSPFLNLSAVNGLMLSLDAVHAPLLTLPSHFEDGE